MDQDLTKENKNATKQHTKRHLLSIIVLITEMQRTIKQQIFALEMEELTSLLHRLQLDNKIVTLLHELWDEMKIGGRCKVEITTNEDGMEVIIVIIGELMIPTFYFTNEKKFWRQLRCIIESSLQN